MLDSVMLWFMFVAEGSPAYDAHLLKESGSLVGNASRLNMTLNQHSKSNNNTERVERPVSDVPIRRSIVAIKLTDTENFKEKRALRCIKNTIKSNAKLKSTS